MAVEVAEVARDEGVEPERQRFPRRPDKYVAQEAALARDVRFGRSRALRVLAGGLFGLATGLVLRARPASAHHLAEPWPCYGGPRCHCCNGRYCCSDCHAHSFLGCQSGGQCWNYYPVPYQGYYYRCCDWHELYAGQHYLCICRGTFYT